MPSEDLIKEDIMTEELKPCPFCGGEAETQEWLKTHKSVLP